MAAACAAGSVKETELDTLSVDLADVIDEPALGELERVSHTAKELVGSSVLYSCENL